MKIHRTVKENACSCWWGLAFREGRKVKVKSWKRGSAWLGGTDHTQQNSNSCTLTADLNCTAQQQPRGMVLWAVWGCCCWLGMDIFGFPSLYLFSFHSFHWWLPLFLFVKSLCSLSQFLNGVNWSFSYKFKKPNPYQYLFIYFIILALILKN